MRSGKHRSPGKFFVFCVEMLLLGLLGLIPFSLRARICEAIGGLLFHLAGRYRRLVLTNLAYAFPDASKDWLLATTRRNFRLLGRSVAEFVQTPRISDAFYDRWFVCEPAEEEHRRAYAGGGIVILGHFGNWEWHGYLAGRLAGRDIYTLVKRHTNYWMNAWVERSRHRAHMQLIYIDQNAFITINRLRHGDVVAFTSDQNAGGAGWFFPFFGRLASTYLGPAAVARNTKVPVYFVWSYHDGEGRLHFGQEPLSRPDGIDPKADPEAWERAFTYSWIKKLEEKVRLHPADYLWSHNRWKAKARDPESIWALYGERPSLPARFE